MKITSTFKKRARLAQLEGYRRVYSVGGGYRATTYCSAWDIDWLLKQPEGTELRAFSAGQKWSGHMNTRHLDPTDIQYSVLMSQY